LRFIVGGGVHDQSDGWNPNLAGAMGMGAMGMGMGMHNVGFHAPMFAQQQV
jgi:hypothetical protein